MVDSGEDLAARIESMRSACDRDPVNPENWAELGALHMEAGENDRAREAFERLKSLRPDAATFGLIGDLALERQDPRGAIEAYEQAHRLDRTDASIAGALAEAYMEAGRTDDARRMLELASKLAPEDGQYLHALAGLALERCDYADLLELGIRLREVDPEDEVSPAYLEAEAMMGLGEVETAARMYRNIAEMEPDLMPVRLSLAQAYLVMDDLAAAERELVEASKIWPESAEIHGSLGRIYLLEEDSERAKDCFAESIRLGPPSPWIYSLLAGCHLDAGEMDRAREVAQQGLQRFPDHSACSVILSKIEIEAGNPAAAAEHANRAIAANPKDHHAHLSLAAAQIDLESDPQTVLGTLDRAVSLVEDEEEREQVLRLRQHYLDVIGER
ncbi:MAG: tetratricopeptide repeat protein [Candidatus Eisenbacteria bacterium]|nr:tetratricopeptide repeat protein [Candidatus Eisenbacteria bacterium]